MTMRFEDMLPAGSEAEWSCGHVGGAMCAECYRLLAAKAHELAMEIERLREAADEIERLRIENENLRRFKRGFWALAMVVFDGQLQPFNLDCFDRQLGEHNK